MEVPTSSQGALMDSRFMACSNVGNRVSELWVVVSEPCEVPEQEEWECEFQCSVHGVFDCEDAAETYAFQLSNQDRTRAYGALCCPTVGGKL